MKTKFMHLLGALLVGGTLMMTSCTKDEDIIPDPTVPTIGFFAGAGLVTDDVTIEQGSSFKVNVRATKGSGNLSEVRVFEDNVLVAVSRIKVDNAAATTNPITVPSFDQGALNWVVEVQAVDHATAHVYKFEVVASDGPAASVSLTVTTFDPGTPVTTLMGVLLNSAGPAGTGGLDLDNGAGTGSADAAAEIRDLGIDLGLPAATNWRQQIAPANNAELRKAPAGLTFGSITTKEQIEAGFNAAGANIANSDKLNGGELFYVRRNTNYYLIRIATVTIRPNMGDNSDFYEVDIKR
jgi:hypothetical protein